MAKKTNSWVLEQARRCQHLANVESRNASREVKTNLWEKVPFQGLCLATRQEESKKTAWIYNVTLWIGLKLADVTFKVGNRSESEE